MKKWLAPVIICCVGMLCATVLTITGHSDAAGSMASVTVIVVMFLALLGVFD